MAKDLAPPVVAISSNIRFVQGYRYLDRCGEAVIRLEDGLDKGWIPAETAPSGGTLRNFTLGMVAQFNAESMTVRQSEFISFEHFRDQTCKIYDVLWKTFEIKRILSPMLRVILAAGFDGLDAASRYLRELRLSSPSDDVVRVLGGSENAFDFTLCTEQKETWLNLPVTEWKRLDVRVIRQEKQPDFDERIMRRLPLIPLRQQEPLGALMKLRRQHPTVAPVAAQFDLERVYFECEFSSETFNLPSFFADSWKWAEQVRSWIGQELKEKRHDLVQG